MEVKRRGEGSPTPGATEMSCKDPATNRLLASLVEVEREGPWLRSKGRWRTISFKRQAVERGRELRDPCWELSLGIKSVGGESILGKKGCSLRRGPRAESWAILAFNTQAEEGPGKKLRRNCWGDGRTLGWEMETEWKRVRSAGPRAGRRPRPGPLGKPMTHAGRGD